MYGVPSAVIFIPISPEHNSLSFNMSTIHETTTVLSMQHVNICGSVCIYSYSLDSTFFISMSLLKVSDLKTTLLFFLNRKMVLYFFLQFLVVSAEQHSIYHNKLRGGEQQKENFW